MSKERKSNKEVKKPKKQPDGVAKPKDDNKNYGGTDGRKQKQLPLSELRLIFFKFYYYQILTNFNILFWNNPQTGY